MPRVGPAPGECGSLVVTTETSNPNGATQAPHPNGATATSGTPTTKRAPAATYSRRFKLIAAVGLTAAIAAFVLAYLSLGDGDDGVTSSGGTDDQVEALLPPDGSQIPNQSMIGIDLTAGWTASLVVDDRAIPADQLNEDRNLYRIEFTPGEGKVFDSLPAGPMCVTARIWEIAAGQDGARNVTWCFEVV